MLRFKRKDSKEMIKRMAKIRECSTTEVREEIQGLIEEAKNRNDPEFLRIFGNKTPTPEEYICKISKNLKF